MMIFMDLPGLSEASGNIDPYEKTLLFKPSLSSTLDKEKNGYVARDQLLYIVRCWTHVRSC